MGVTMKEILDIGEPGESNVGVGVSLNVLRSR